MENYSKEAMIKNIPSDVDIDIEMENARTIFNIACEIARVQGKELKDAAQEAKDLFSIASEVARVQENATKNARAIFNSAHEVDKHPYLTKKRIKAYGIRTIGDDLVIPIFDIKGNLTSIQRIDENGKKRLFKGGWMKGCFFHIGNLAKSESVIICEGYATGATLFDIVHKPIVIAFNAGNLKSVGVEIREKYPDKKIIFAADNDQLKPVNIGVENALEASLEVKGEVVIPKFKNLDKNPSNFNDLYVLEGEESVVKHFKNI